MTFFVEIDGRFQRRPGRFNSRVMCRFWWGYIAFGWIKLPLDQYSAEAAAGRYEWREGA